MARLRSTVSALGANPGQLSSAPRPHKEADVATRLQQSTAKIATGGAGANDQNAHNKLPSNHLRVPSIGEARRHVKPPG
jgi:hypothetical protein